MGKGVSIERDKVLLGTLWILPLDSRIRCLPTGMYQSLQIYFPQIWKAILSFLCIVFHKSDLEPCMSQGASKKIYCYVPLQLYLLFLFTSHPKADAQPKHRKGHFLYQMTKPSYICMQKGLYET